jgi:EAL domain-containing protein (putative c-di-GMP-specific phosphodiesterase class I)/CheY-like chemotaxis protein
MMPAILSVTRTKLAMSAIAAQSSAVATPVPPLRQGSGHPALCFVIDPDSGMRQFLSLLLHGAGIDTEEFADGTGLQAAVARRVPDLIFLDVPIESAEAIACVGALRNGGYSGRLQLMSSRGAAVLAHVKSMGERQQLQMLPVLRKPFETNVIIKLLAELRLGHPPAVAGRIDLDKALSEGWIEFWYQPKIDLRKKQLVGAEVFARARHPTFGVLLPGAFTPGARESSLVTLSEMALSSALRTGLSVAKLGVNLRMAVNIPVNVLVKLALADIVQVYIPQFEKWPGLTIDVSEEQILTDLALAFDLRKRLQHLDVKLAIDDFGRGYSSLARLKESPFAELKLDRAFVIDCSIDRVNAPLCRSVIDLAHNFGSVAAAIGIEKASDAMALVGMGCDVGQGFLLGQPMPEDRFESLLRQRTTAPARQVAEPERAMDA